MKYEDSAIHTALRAKDRHAAAALLGCSPNSLYGIMRRRGLAKPDHWPGTGRRLGSSNRPLEEMQAAAARSSTYTELGRILGVTRQAAYQLGVRHGLELKKLKKD